MADSKAQNFDHYHRWLGIPKTQRPPTHYQLLGLTPGESDLDVIEESALRQTTYLRSYQTGPHAADCTRILNEIARARVVLLDPQKKKAYDAQLFAKEKPSPSETDAEAFAFEEAVTTKPARKAPTEKARRSDESGKEKRPARSVAKTDKGPPVVLFAAIGGGVFLVAVVAAAAWMLTAGGAPEGPPIVEGKKPVLVDPKPDPKPIVPKIGDPVALKAGHLGHWSFDEGQGREAIDSKFGHKATIKGGRWIDGVKGKAIRFDADDQYVEIPAETNLRFKAGEPFTISVWFKTAAVEGPVAMLRNRKSDVPMVNIQVVNQLISLHTRDDNGGGNAVFGSRVNDDAWHHVAVTRKDQTLELFLDGTPQGRVVGAGGPMTLDWLCLGAELWWVKTQWSRSPYLRGAIDEFSAFNRALSADEIRALAKDQAIPVAAPFNLRDYLGDWEQTEELGKPYVRQVAIFERDGVPEARYAVFREGRLLSYGRSDRPILKNNVVSFATKHDWSAGELGDRFPMSYRFENGQIYERWVATGEKDMVIFRRAAAKDLANVVGRWTAKLDDGRRFQLQLSRPANFAGRMSSSSAVNPSVGDDECQFPRIRGTSLAFDYRAPVAGIPGCDEVVLTADGDAKLTGEFFAAGKSLATVSFVRDEPTAPRADQLPGLVAYWSLDEGQGVLATDKKNSLKARLKGGRWVDGVKGKAIQFDAEGEYLDYSDAAGLNFKAGEPFTFAGWVKTTATEATLVSQRARNGAVIDLLIRNDRLHAEVREDNGGEVCSFAGGPISNGQWRHFACTRNGETIELFVDGVSQGKKTTAAAGGPITTNQRAFGAELEWIATGARFGVPHLKGALDELQIFNRTLSAEEIRALAAPPARDAVPERTPNELPGAIAYWPFDEGKGTQSTDKKRYLKTTLKGGRWVDGVRGKAIQFDADGEYADYSTKNLNFKAGEPFTFAGWIKTTATEGAFVSHRSTTNASPVIDFFLNSGRIIAMIRNDTGGLLDVTQVTAGAVNNGQWRHFAVTRKGQTIEVFIDGVSSAQMSGSGADGPITTDLLTLGAEIAWAKTNFRNHGSPFFRGAIDDYCIFKRALTNDEILALAVRPTAKSPTESKSDPTIPLLAGAERDAKVTMSFVGLEGRPQMANDGIEPKSSAERGVVEFCHWWPHTGGEEWIQYTWQKPVTTGGVRVYWSDQTGFALARVPTSWKLLSKDGDEWKPVQVQGKYPTDVDKYCEVRFTPVTTTELRLVVQMQQGMTAGIHEWKVLSPESTVAKIDPKVDPKLKATAEQIRDFAGEFESNLGNGAEVRQVAVLYEGGQWFAHFSFFRSGKLQAYAHAEKVEFAAGQMQCDLVWEMKAIGFPDRSTNIYRPDAGGIVEIAKGRDYTFRRVSLKDTARVFTGVWVCKLADGRSFRWDSRPANAKSPGMFTATENDATVSNACEQNRLRGPALVFDLKTPILDGCTRVVMTPVGAPAGETMSAEFQSAGKRMVTLAFSREGAAPPTAESKTKDFDLDEYLGDWEHVETGGQRLTRQITLHEYKSNLVFHYTVVRDKKVIGYGHGEKLTFAKGVLKGFAVPEIAEPGGGSFAFEYRLAKGQIVQQLPVRAPLLTFRRPKIKDLLVAVVGRWSGRTDDNSTLFSNVDFHSGQFSGIFGANSAYSESKFWRLHGSSILFDHPGRVLEKNCNRILLTPTNGDLVAEYLGPNGLLGKNTLTREPLDRVHGGHWQTWIADAAYEGPETEGVSRQLWVANSRLDLPRGWDPTKWEANITFVKAGKPIGIARAEAIVFDDKDKVLSGKWVYDVKPFENAPADFRIRFESLRLSELDMAGKTQRLFTRERLASNLANVMGEPWFAKLDDGTRFQVQCGIVSDSLLSPKFFFSPPGGGAMKESLPQTFRLYGESFRFETPNETPGVKDCRHAVLTPEGPYLRCEFFSSANASLQSFLMTRDGSGVIPK